MNNYDRLLDFLCELEQENIHYTLEHNREDSIMILAVTPGRRWEIEFFSDGHIETEGFVSEGVESREAAEAHLEQFWRENREQPAV